MPLRSDPSLWWNIPGIVAAYQPVRAPDPLLARYNMRMGGTSAYRAEPGVAPTWKSTTGWTFTGTQWLNTKYIPPASVCSFLVRFTNAADTNGMLLGSFTSGSILVYISPGFFSAIRYSNGSSAVVVSPNLVSGVLGIAGLQGYRNGRADGAALAAGGASTQPLAFGLLYGASSNFFTGDIQAGAIYNRTLSPAEVRTVSRQMQYCDVNPDWSVWSPRRKWFPYVLAGGGFQAAWAERANRLIGGG